MVSLASVLFYYVSLKRIFEGRNECMLSEAYTCKRFVFYFEGYAMTHGPFLRKKLGLFYFVFTMLLMKYSSFFLSEVRGRGSWSHGD